MTCIIGCVEKGMVYIGGDSCGGNTSLWTNVIRKDKKVFKTGEFLIGFTTSFRMGQLMKYKFNPPDIKEGQDVYEYMCVDFIDAIKSLFKTNNYGPIKDSEQSGGTFLIGVRGRLFKIESDFQVEELEDDYNACGCGIEFALASMYVLQDSNKSPEEKIELSLKASEYYSAYVKGPFHINKI